VAKAPADGYTILITPLPFSALPGLYGSTLPYDALKDFQPLVWAGSTQNALVVRNELPVNNVREFLEYARKNPGKLNYGSTGSGSSNHLTMELLMKMTGVKLAHIPYKGSAPAVTAMLGGEIDALFDNVPNVLPHIKAGKYPDVPTVAESGYPGFQSLSWSGISVAKGVPQPIVDKLEAAAVQALQSEALRNRLTSVGFVIPTLGGKAYTAFIKSEIDTWTRVIKTAGIKPE